MACSRVNFTFNFTGRPVDISWRFEISQCLHLYQAFHVLTSCSNWPRKWKHYTSPKGREIFTQRNVTSEANCICMSLVIKQWCFGFLYHALYWACSDVSENSICGTATRFSLWPLRLCPFICAVVSNGTCWHVCPKRRKKFILRQFKNPEDHHLNNTAVFCCRVGEHWA